MRDAKFRIRKRSSRAEGLVSSLRSRLPGAFSDPTRQELVSLYKLRYRMAMDEEKFDAALVFLNKIIEVDPKNYEAKWRIGQIHHLHTREYSRAIEHYNRVIRLAPAEDPARAQAKSSLSELIEMVS